MYAWWKDATVYQIYPFSFKDSNGDGIGDIPGIISKLDYLQFLGIDVLWITPHYKSADVDSGYDVVDYHGVNSKFGTMADVEALIEQCHARDIRIIFDLVVTYTSNLHPWFVESKSSRDSAKRDWYIWHDGRIDTDGHRMPPNNWASRYKGSAWDWDETSQQYYLHMYDYRQPDLNWRNMEVRKTIYNDVILFWLKKGIDGFRVDTVMLYSKPLDLTQDAPVTDPSRWEQNASIIVENGPQLHEILQEMNEIGFGPYGCMTVGEGAPATYDQAEKFVGQSRHELSMSFNFDHLNIGFDAISRRVMAYDLGQFKRAVSKWQRFITERPESWTTVFLESHDLPRSISRICNDSTKELRVAAAKLLCTLLMTLSGTLYIYQGQEIGMVNVQSDLWPMDRMTDIRTQYDYNEAVQRGDSPEQLDELKKFLYKFGRENTRTPFQWDSSSPNAGFTEPDVEPWMPVNEYYKEINAYDQLYDPFSVLSFYRNGLVFRRNHSDLTCRGEFTLQQGYDDRLFAYTKSEHGNSENKILVVLNFSTGPVEFSETGSLIFSSERHISGLLQPYEATVFRLYN